VTTLMAAIYSHLSAATGIAGLEFYHQETNQGTPPPYAIMTEVMTERYPAYGMITSLRVSEISLEDYATSDVDAASWAQVIIDALDGTYDITIGSIRISNINLTYESDAIIDRQDGSGSSLFGRHLEFRVGWVQCST